MTENTKRYLIANRWKTPEGEILQSKHRHDFVQSGNYFVDGGLDYIRLTPGLEDLCVYSDSPHEDKRESFKWGTYGKDGKQDLQWITLKDMTTDHVLAIIETQVKYISPHVLEMFKDEVKFREKNNEPNS